MGGTAFGNNCSLGKWLQMTKQKLQAKKVFSSRFLVVLSSLSRRRKQNFEMQQKRLSG